MFWPRLSRDDFRSKLENISFLSSYVRFEEFFFVSRAFEKFGAKRSSSGALVSMMSWRSFRKLRSVTGHVFATSDYDHEYFFRISFLFSKAEPMLLA